jgi:hypothetical protein
MISQSGKKTNFIFVKDLVFYVLKLINFIKENKYETFLKTELKKTA